MKYQEITTAADQFMKLATKTEKTKSGSSAIFPADSPKVLDSAEHFPIKTENQARNALARVNQYKKAPPWYKGSLQSLVTTVCNKVHKKYPGIEISDASKNPGKD